MSRTIKHPITKGFLDYVEHARKQRKDNKQVEADLKLIDMTE